MKLGISYAGQGLPAIAFQVLQHLMKELNVREQLTGPEKCAILERFDHRCAFCGSRAKHMQFDHIVRHSESFGAAPIMLDFVPTMPPAQDKQRSS